MARIALTADNKSVVVQGFRHGGGINLPYVYVGVLDGNENLTDEFTLGLGWANELSEFFRQEAEFAASAREDEEAGE